MYPRLRLQRHARGQAQPLSSSKRRHSALHAEALLHPSVTASSLSGRSIARLVGEHSGLHECAFALERCFNFRTLTCRAQADPARAAAFVSDAAVHIDQLDGKGVSQALAVAVLTGMLLPDLFERALHPSILRTLQFSTEDQELLHHVNVAAQVFNRDCTEDAPALPTLPLDVSTRVAAAERATQAAALPLYASLHTRVQRIPGGPQAAFQHSILMNGQGAPLSSDKSQVAYTAHVALPAHRVVLELEGGWNLLPGSHTRSLPARLREANLQHLGWYTQFIPADTWSAAVDKLPLYAGHDRVQEVVQTAIAAAAKQARVTAAADAAPKPLPSGA